MYLSSDLANVSFWPKGKDQVAVGVAPIDFSNKSSESALSIYPLAIANCKEKRLVVNLCLTDIVRHLLYCTYQVLES